MVHFCAYFSSEKKRNPDVRLTKCCAVKSFVHKVCKSLVLHIFLSMLMILMLSSRFLQTPPCKHAQVMRLQSSHATSSSTPLIKDRKLQLGEKKFPWGAHPRCAARSGRTRRSPAADFCPSDWQVEDKADDIRSAASSHVVAQVGQKSVQLCLRGVERTWSRGADLHGWMSLQAGLHLWGPLRRPRLETEGRPALSPALHSQDHAL